MLLPGIVVLAAFGLPTLKRGTANAIDWFSLLLFSLAGLFVWFSWVTRMTGIPRAWAASIERQTPGLVPEFRPMVFVIALAATIGWFWIVHWRIVKHPKVLWRSVVLSSGGLILVWILVNTLFLYSIDYSRTYREVAREIGAKLGPDASRRCVQTDGLGLSQRASFAYFAGLSFLPNGNYSEGPIPPDCPYLLRQDLTRSPRPETLPPGEWKLIWEGRRASDKDERFRLFSRLKAPEES
jgi:4-amino-4-deoxy-L-arabinose transferase-like glycosyltransferase